MFDVENNLKKNQTIIFINDTIFLVCLFCLCYRFLKVNFVCVCYIFLKGRSNVWKPQHVPRFSRFLNLANVLEIITKFYLGNHSHL